MIARARACAMSRHARLARLSTYCRSLLVAFTVSTAACTHRHHREEHTRVVRDVIAHSHAASTVVKRRQNPSPGNRVGHPFCLHLPDRSRQTRRWFSLPAG